MKWINKLAGLGLIAALIFAIGASTKNTVLSPPPAKALPGIPGPCDLIPDGIAKKICEGATDPVGTAIDAIPGIPSPSDIAAGVVNDIVGPILRGIARAEADAVVYVLKQETQFINASTTPNITADWFTHQYAVVFGMAVFVAIAMFYLRLGFAVKEQSAAEAGNAGMAIIGFFLLGGLLPILVQEMLHVFDDQIAPGWMNIAGSSATDTLNGLGSKISQSVSGGGVVTAILVPLVILFFGLIGGVIVELMLFFREGMLYAVTAAEIVAFGLWVGGRWGRDMFERTSMTLVALLLFKVIMSFVLTIGLLLFGTSDSGVSPVILGSVVLLMVPFLSWWAFRRISGHDIRTPHEMLVSGVGTARGYVGTLTP